MVKIFVNAGHGGQDPGAISKNGTKEKDICLNISSILVKKLILKGFQVEFFQQEQSVYEISKAENKSKADIFISIHCNASVNPKANGIETLYHPVSKLAKNLAQEINNSLCEVIGLKNRGIKERKNLHVLNRTYAPAVLIECAFLSNPSEECFLQYRAESFADAILQGIFKYLS